MPAMEIESTNNTSSSATNEQPVNAAARYEELKNLVASMESDFVRFYVQGNKAAGTRVRGAMQELKNLAQTIRTEVQTIKNEGKNPS
jgi:hypothetical protein